MNDELSNIKSVNPDGTLDLYSFNIGLLKLIKFASKLTEIDKDDILMFNEIEFNKQLLCIKHSILKNFIAINFISDLNIFLQKNIINKIKNINNLKFFLEYAKLFFQEYFFMKIFLERKLKNSM